MRLERVQIENYRAIRRLAMDFDEITTIIGEHDCGKSSLISLLSTVLNPTREGVLPGFVEADFHIEIAAESRAERRKKNPRVELTAYEDYGTLWNSHLAPNYRFTRDYDFADVDRTASDRWIGEINDQLNTSRRKQIYIYVHGFNTKFDKNTRICAEFWHYMGRDGVMMSFDWPSRGSVFSYQDDKANSEVGIRQFRTLLEFLATESDAERINIIAHSAGTRIVVEALRDLSLRYYDLPDDEAQERTRIGRLA